MENNNNAQEIKRLYKLLRYFHSNIDVNPVKYQRAVSKTAEKINALTGVKKMIIISELSR